MSPSACVTVTRPANPRVAVVTLSQPEKKNALSEVMWRQLAEALDALAADESLAAAVITGAGSDFAAGGDLSEFPTVRADRERASRYHEEAVRPALLALRDFPLPLIAAVEGACVGGGLEIAALCDWVIAAQNAYFGAPIARLSFAMYPGELELIAARLPRPILARLLLGAELLPPTALAASGWIAAIVAPGEALPTALEHAQRLAQLDPRVARAHKALLARIATGTPLSPEERLAGLAWVEDAAHRAALAKFLRGK